MPGALEAELRGKTLVFFDGVCVLCSGVVRFLLPRDRDDRLRFGALQGETAERLLPPLGVEPEKLEGIVVLTEADTPEQNLLTKASAALALARQLGVGWRLLGRLAGLLPVLLLDWAYDRVASRRYRWFGKQETCFLPSPEERRRFLDHPVGTSGRLPEASV